MRFGWFILVTLTAGLAFPFMAAHLFRYRFNHTWYGTQRLKSVASWRHIAGPFYLFWVLFVVLLVAFFVVIGASVADPDAGAVLVSVATLLFVVFLGLAYSVIASRERSRFVSSISIGDTGVRLRLRARSLIGMYVLFVIVLTITAVVISLAIGAAAAGFFVSLQAELPNMSFETVMQALGPGALFLAIGAYLAFLAIFAILTDLFLALSYWKLVAANIELTNPSALDNVRAEGEEAPSFGEGLADAFGGGAY